MMIAIIIIIIMIIIIIIIIIIIVMSHDLQHNCKRYNIIVVLKQRVELRTAIKNV